MILYQNREPLLQELDQYLHHDKIDTQNQQQSLISGQKLAGLNHKKRI